jgi:hypothetical protein
MKITQGCRAVVTVHFDDIPTGWEQWVLLRADAHHDNAHCRQDLERAHLEEAKRRNALVCDFGDLFCAMQGKWDKRADDTQLRTELRGNDYLDRLVRYNSDFYAPYADNLLLIAPGNHETAILKHHQTNLTERLAEHLKAKRTVANPLCVGGFSGWVRFMFKRANQCDSRLLKWHHGYGGDAPVTKGTIQTNRMAVYLPDADFVVTGHTHNEWIFPIIRERISQAGVLFKDRQVHIKVPGYKDEYADGFDGWHIERGGPPKPIGAAWVRFFRKGHDIESEVLAANG